MASYCNRTLHGTARVQHSAEKRANFPLAVISVWDSLTLAAHDSRGAPLPLGAFLARFSPAWRGRKRQGQGGREENVERMWNKSPSARTGMENAP